MSTVHLFLLHCTVFHGIKFCDYLIFVKLLSVHVHVLALHHSLNNFQLILTLMSQVLSVGTGFDLI